MKHIWQPTTRPMIDEVALTVLGSYSRTSRFSQGGFTRLR